MAATIAVLSQKGGTGKTTAVRHLADTFRRAGLRVAAVDLDPQGNLSDYFDVPPDAALELAMLRLPPNLNVELFEWQSVDQRTQHPRHSDRGGHHLCFVVDDLRSTLRALEGRGMELIDREPRRGAEGDVAFIHPRASGGVLVELIDRSSLETPHTS